MYVNFDTNLNMPSTFYQLLVKLRKKYGYASSTIDGYTQSYASNGVLQSNTASQTTQTSQTNDTNNTNQVSDLTLKESLDYNQLIKELKLNVVENRFALMLLLPYAELMQMLNFLEKEQLVNGLKFFTKEKLLTLVGTLSKTDILKMLFQMFTNRTQLIENLPTKEIMNFFARDEVQKKYIMKTFELMPREMLAKMAGRLTGKNCEKMSKRDLLHEIEPFKKYRIVDELRKLDEKTLRTFTTNLCESFPKLYDAFSYGSLYDLTSKFARTDICESMTVLDNEKLINMVGQLPEKLLALTASQIDPNVFSQILLTDYKDLLANLVLAQ